MIDLHLHLDGSLSVELIEFLAKQQQIALPDPLSPSIQASPRCQDLNEYPVSYTHLDVYKRQRLLYHILPVPQKDHCLQNLFISPLF